MRNKLLTAFLLGLITALLFAYTNNWVESTPTDATVANQIDDFNRKLRVDVSDRLKTYIGGFVASDSNAGFYQVLFLERASFSTPAANKYVIGGKLIGGKCELVGKDEAGNEIQLTSKGANLATNTFLTSANAAGSGTVDLIKADVNDVPVLPDGVKLATSAAPTANSELANKKYVDDQSGAGTGYFDADSTQMFSGTCTTADTFQDLDLSSVTGSNAALVYLKVKSSTTTIVAFRPNGHTDGVSYSTLQALLDDGGCSIGGIHTNNYVVYITTVTDSSGIVEWTAGSTSPTITISMVGYVK